MNKLTDKAFQQERWAEIKELCSAQEFQKVLELINDPETCEGLQKAATKHLANAKAELNDSETVSDSQRRIVRGAEDCDGYDIVWSVETGADESAINMALFREFGDEDFANRWTPKAPTPLHCLREALKKISRKSYNIDNLKDGVWAISEKIKTSSHVGVDYDPQLKVESNKSDGELKFSNDEHPLKEVVLNAYNDIYQNGAIPSENVRRSVETFLRRELGSVARRKRGSGVDYIKAHKGQLFRRYKRALESADAACFDATEVIYGPASITSLVNCIKRSHKRHIEAANKALEDGVGKKALNNREGDLLEHQVFLEQWLDILGDSFEDLSKSLEETMTKVVLAQETDFGEK